ncbi:MAG: glycosyltransferase, partial [Nitrospinaceae bacterium]|nr:glycosyltransferase family 2 protein [Nitrospinaceae bacterium]NIR57917.1 glycosyltransferase family 2 protein [Nitrospinaceae bacterium]NIS88375.1 glycosyltransferase family 2 protein [Nitrospinaceae bacterium]NIT85253.1 glycosyltransferase family 2 protein [Nitrospinaceae bacterium]NIU47406.1 glycosyltransferase family 2 protein [Nitrospinaceae bacterium]
MDQWVVLDMPETLYYHKHLMYNVGIALSRGNLVTICDSDAMVKPTFVETLIRFFEENPDRVLH